MDGAERDRAAAGRAKPVPGPPKRFAQAMGAVMSTAALVLALVVGDHTAADVVLIAVPARRRARVDLRLLPRLQDLRRC